MTDSPVDGMVLRIWSMCVMIVSEPTPHDGEIDIRISHNIVLTSSTNINNDRTRAGQTLSYTATELSEPVIPSKPGIKYESDFYHLSGWGWRRRK